MKRWSGKLRRNVMFLFLVIMPFGVRVDPEHPDQLALSLHGGSGQLVSVLRDCDGNVTASEESRFTEVAGSLQYSHRLGSGDYVLVGVRHGVLDSRLRYPTTSYDYPDIIYGSSERDIHYRYWNPYVAIESFKVGLGVGILSGEFPANPGDIEPFAPVSAHLRLGDARRQSFLLALNEDLPLVTGAGYLRLGINYPAGTRVILFTGLAAGFFEGPGLAQGIGVAVSDAFDLDLRFRLGSVDGRFEGGAAVGLRYRFPFGRSKAPIPEPTPAIQDENKNLDLR